MKERKKWKYLSVWTHLEAAHIYSPPSVELGKEKSINCDKLHNGKNLFCVCSPWAPAGEFSQRDFMMTQSFGCWFKINQIDKTVPVLAQSCRSESGCAEEVWRSFPVAAWVTCSGNATRTTSQRATLLPTSSEWVGWLFTCSIVWEPPTRLILWFSPIVLHDTWS